MNRFHSSLVKTKPTTAMWRSDWFVEIPSKDVSLPPLLNFSFPSFLWGLFKGNQIELNSWLPGSKESRYVALEEGDRVGKEGCRERRGALLPWRWANVGGFQSKRSPQCLLSTQNIPPHLWALKVWHAFMRTSSCSCKMKLLYGWWGKGRRCNSFLQNALKSLHERC